MTQRSKGTTVVLYMVGLLYGLMILVPLAWVVMVSAEDAARRVRLPAALHLQANR